MDSYSSSSLHFLRMFSSIGIFIQVFTELSSKHIAMVNSILVKKTQPIDML